MLDTSRMGADGFEMLVQQAVLVTEVLASGHNQTRIDEAHARHIPGFEIGDLLVECFPLLLPARF